MKILPITPSSRRRREDSSALEEATPSKKYRRRIGEEEEVEEHESKAMEDNQPGRTEEKLGEALHVSMSNEGEQGGQGSNRAMGGRIFKQKKLRPSHSQGEDTGRPGEAFKGTGGGQSRDEQPEGGSNCQTEKGGYYFDEDN